MSNHKSKSKKRLSKAEVTKRMSDKKAHLKTLARATYLETDKSKAFTVSDNLTITVVDYTKVNASNL